MKNPLRHFRHLAAAAAFVSLLTVHSSLLAAGGGAIDTRGIPVDAQGIIYADYAQGTKSVFFTALWRQTGQKDYEGFKTQYGFDPVTDISTVIIGLAKPAYASAPLALFGVIRGKFSPEKIVTGAKQDNARVTTEGKYTVIDDVIRGIPNQPSEKMTLCIIDSSTLLFAQTKADLAKIIAAYTGQAKSYAAPDAFDKLRKRTETPLILGYLGHDITPDASDNGMMTIPKSDSIYFSLAEDRRNLLARVCLDFASPDDARQLQGAVQMFTGLMQLGGAAAIFGGSGSQAAQAQMLQKLLSALQVNLNGNTLDMSFSLPVTDILQAMQTYFELSKTAVGN